MQPAAARRLLPLVFVAAALANVTIGVWFFFRTRDPMILIFAFQAMVVLLVVALVIFLVRRDAQKQ